MEHEVQFITLHVSKSKMESVTQCKRQFLHGMTFENKNSIQLNLFVNANLTDRTTAQCPHYISNLLNNFWVTPTSMFDSMKGCYSVCYCRTISRNLISLLFKMLLKHNLLSCLTLYSGLSIYIKIVSYKRAF